MGKEQEHIKRSLVVELSREKLNQAIEEFLGVPKGYSIVEYVVDGTEHVNGCKITTCASSLPHEVFKQIQNKD